MNTETDGRRKRFVWRNDSNTIEYFFIDEYSYKCVEQNIIDANRAINTTIEYRYGKEGWKALLIYYATTLLNMYWEHLDELGYVVDNSTIFECECLEKTRTHMSNQQVIYEIDWPDKQILRTLIKLANHIQWAMKNIFDIDKIQTNIDDDYYDGDNQQEADTTYEDCLEEDD